MRMITAATFPKEKVNEFRRGLRFLQLLRTHLSTRMVCLPTLIVHPSEPFGPTPADTEPKPRGFHVYAIGGNANNESNRTQQERRHRMNRSEFMDLHASSV